MEQPNIIREGFIAELTTGLIHSMITIRETALSVQNLSGKFTLSIYEDISDKEFSQIRRDIARVYSLTGDGYTLTEGLCVKLKKI